VRAPPEKMGMLGFSPSQWQMMLTGTKNESLWCFSTVIGRGSIPRCIYVYHTLSIYVYTYILHIYNIISLLHTLKIIKKYITSTHQPNPRRQVTHIPHHQSCGCVNICYLEADRLEMKHGRMMSFRFYSPEI